MTVRFREKRTRFRVAVEGVVVDVVDDVVDAMLLNSDVVCRLVQVDGGVMWLSSVVALKMSVFAFCHYQRLVSKYLRHQLVVFSS